jgi:O-acetylserine/cysteine efflux transporter
MSSTAVTHEHFGSRELGIAAIVNVAFALNIIAMKVVVTATAPLLSVAARMFVVALVCAPWFRRIPGKTLALALYGALNGGLFLLVLNLALNMATNVGALAIAGQLGVPFSLLLGFAVFGERLSPIRLIGVGLAFAGVALLVFDPAIVGELPAVLMMALSTFLWACGTLIQRRLGGVTALNAQAWNGLMGALLLTPFALIFEPAAIAKLPDVGWTLIGWFAFSCVGATVIGQGALAWLLQRHPIATVMPLVLASPVLATLFASLYFRTAITLSMIASGLVALTGVAIISLNPPKPAG